MSEFRKGRKVETVYFRDSSFLSSEDLPMTVSMENGHMAAIPYIRIILSDGGVCMVPADSVTVILAPEEETENGP